MKKWIKIIIAIVVALVFIRAIVVIVSGDKKSIISKPSIAVMDIAGQIMDSKATVKTLDKLEKNDLVKGVIVRVNSPGGAITPSMEMYQRLLTLGKPVYVAMGPVAASGGYLISLGADVIYAEPSTLTGSIGVIMSLVNTKELMEKIGIKNEVIKSGAFKDSGNPLRDMTEADKKVLNDVLMDLYGQFTDIVVQRRGLSQEKVLSLADGRIYTGKMAYQEGLINKLGSWQVAFDEMKEKLNIPNLEMYEVEEEKTMMEKLSKLLGTNSTITKILSLQSGFLYLATNY